MKLYFIAFLFLILSCENEESRSEETHTNDEHQIEVKTEDVKDSIPQDISVLDDFDSSCTEGGIPALNDFLDEFLSSQESQEVIKALNIYEKLDTDSAMRHFYKRTLPAVSRTLNTAFYKFKESYTEEEEWNSTEDWNAYVGTCIPFMIFILDNHFDGAEGYEFTSELLEKAEQTSGRSDDDFFEAYIKCRGEYSAAYSSLHFEQIACDISTSTYGGGFHYEALKSVMKADSVSSLFKEDLKTLADYILSEKEITTFGYSKDSVNTEIEQILSLKDRIAYDFSKLEHLKLFIDTTSRTLYFNCLDGSCPP